MQSAELKIASVVERMSEQKTTSPQDLDSITRFFVPQPLLSWAEVCGSRIVLPPIEILSRDYPFLNA
jgi:hypothetical protein